MITQLTEEGAPAVMDAPSLEDHYRDCWPALVRLGRLLTGSQAIGEELAQDAYIGLLGAKRPVDNPSAYLRRSIVNRCINASRHAKYEQSYLAQQREGAVEPPELDEMWNRLRRLPAKQRTVLVLRYYEDLSEREIATVMGCKPGTVKSLSSRALEQLRKDLS